MPVPAPMQALSANSQAYTGALPALHQIGTVQYNTAGIHFQNVCKRKGDVTDVVVDVLSGGMSHIMEQQQLHHAPPQGQGQGQGQGQPHQSLYRPQQHQQQQQQQLMGMTQVQQQQMMQQGVQYLAMSQGAEGGAATLTGPNGQQVHMHTSYFSFPHQFLSCRHQSICNVT